MATMRSVDALEEVDLKEKKVLVRVDLDVPLDDNFNITDDTKILEALVTIKYLIGRGAKVILSSHLGCPKGVTPKYSLKPLVPRLSELLGVEVKMANDCIGAEVEKMVAEIPGGGVLLLENVRFYKEEEKNDPEFAKKLASLADLYVNDAIGTAAHASTEGVAKYFKPSVSGFLMEKKKAEASAAAPGVFHVKPLMEDQNLEETRVQAQEDLYLQTKRKRREESSQLKIFFSDKDLLGEQPHKGPLVITLKVGNCLVDMIMVDTGSSCNIMSLDAFKKLGFTEDDLRPPPLNNREARSNGQVVQPKGVVTLPVHAGSKTVDTEFLVIDASSTYNVILGISWIHEMKAVVLIYHRLLKFPNKDLTAIEDIRGEAFDSTKTVIWNIDYWKDLGIR